jgi:hypothetical protein
MRVYNSLGNNHQFIKIPTMKKATLIIAILFAANAVKAQHHIKRDTAEIIIEMPNDTVAGMVFKRKATYECLISNYRSKTNAVQWRVNYFALNGDPVTIVPAYTIEQIASEQIFLYADATTAALSETELLVKHGIKDSLDSYIKDSSGNYLYNRADIYDGWSIYMKMSKLPVPITTLIKSAGTRAAHEGRLNKK